MQTLLNSCSVGTSRTRSLIKRSLNASERFDRVVKASHVIDAIDRNKSRIRPYLLYLYYIPNVLHSNDHSLIKSIASPQ